MALISMWLLSRCPPVGECPSFYCVDHESPEMFLSSSGCFHQSRRAELEPLLHSLPRDVGEECLDVGRSLCRFVIKQIGVFPYIHNEERNEPRHMPMFMETDPVIGKTAARWVQRAHSPTHASHLPHAGKIQFPHVIAAETVFGRFHKCRASIGLRGSAML